MANISKINFTSDYNYSNNIKRTKKGDSRNNNRHVQFYTINSEFEDEFVRTTKPRSRKKQTKNKPVLPKTLVVLAASLGVTACAPKAIAFISKDNESPVIIAENPQKAKFDDIFETETSEIFQMPQEDYCEFVRYAMMDSDEEFDKIIENESVASASAPKYAYSPEAEELLNEILEKDEHAIEHLENLKKSFNYELSENEILSNLIYLCSSPEWGNDCIDPLILYAQICQESDCKNDALGDYSEEKKEYLALGFGQFHKCAVDEVNEQIEKGTYGNSLYNQGEKYTLEDRKDPKKSLEMMILLLRYDASKTNSTEAMLAMYNRGNRNGINTEDGKEYVKKVYSRISAEK